MRPLNGNVFLKEIANNADTTPGGVILPETRKLQYEIGLVVHPGEGARLPDGTFSAPRFATGNVVAYHANSGVRFTMKGHPCRFVLESNMIAVLQENALEEAVPTVENQNWRDGDMPSDEEKH